MKKALLFLLALGLMLLTVTAAGAGEKVKEKDQLSVQALPHVLTVDGVNYFPYKVVGNDGDPTAHYSTPLVQNFNSAFSERHVWDGGGADKLPCEFGIHWIDNKNNLNVSHCLDDEEEPPTFFACEDGVVVESPDGQYETPEEAALDPDCVEEVVRYDCVDGDVVSNPDGQYESEEEAALDPDCVVEVIRYDCEDGQVVQNPDGEYATADEAKSDPACKKATTTTTVPITTTTISITTTTESVTPSATVGCGVITVTQGPIEFQVEGNLIDLDTGVFTFDFEIGDKWAIFDDGTLLDSGVMDDDCDVPEITTTTLPVVTTTSTPVTPACTENCDELPFTGVNSAYVLLGALALLAAGGLALRVARER